MIVKYAKTWSFTEEQLSFRTPAVSPHWQKGAFWAHHWGSVSGGIQNPNLTYWELFKHLFWGFDLLWNRISIFIKLVEQIEWLIEWLIESLIPFRAFLSSHHLSAELTGFPRKVMEQSCCRCVLELRHRVAGVAGVAGGPSANRGPEDHTMMPR